MDKSNMIDFSEVINNIYEIDNQPCYLVNSEKLALPYQKLDMTFKNIYLKFQIAYSYKTNYIPRICQIIYKLGGYSEIVSPFELEIASRLNIPYKKIIYNGPDKRDGN